MKSRGCVRCRNPLPAQLTGRRRAVLQAMRPQHAQARAGRHRRRRGATGTEGGAK
jgi:hypothetical protein